MGMPKMAIWEMLGSMFDKDGNNTLGWVAHFMMGVIFASSTRRCGAQASDRSVWAAARCSASCTGWLSAW
jgi:hypothetical protein